MGMADRTRRKQCKQCAQGGLLGIAECIFGLLCAAGWLWLGARTIRAARCILASSSAAPASTQPISGRVLNGYSGDELVYNKTLGDWRTHNGIDYACAKDAAVQSPTAGTVVLAGSDGSWGPTVAIKDSAGRVWRLCGVASPAVKEGETVSAGQTLGKVGSVSCECAEESHIHLEVKQDDSYLDPAKLMQ